MVKGEVEVEVNDMVKVKVNDMVKLKIQGDHLDDAPAFSLIR